MDSNVVQSSNFDNIGIRTPSQAYSQYQHMTDRHANYTYSSVAER